MRLTFIGAAHEVTGSCYYLEAAGKKFIVDCGMEQGPDQYENQDIPVAFSDLDFALLTHAHIDHSGDFPLAYARGFRQRQRPVICVTLCFVTVHIFRCLRQSGETEKPEETGSRNLCRPTPWKMR